MVVHVAVKIVDLEKLGPVFEPYGISLKALEANLRREVQVMSRLCHHNIVRLENSFWVNRSAYICMELVEGRSLVHHIPNGGMEEGVAKGIFYQICTAVAYCHSHQVRNHKKKSKRKEKEKGKKKRPKPKETKKKRITHIF